MLETGHGVLFETGAILPWLADRHGALGPGTADPGRGDFLTWLLFVSNTLHTELRISFYPHQYAGGDRAAQSTLRRHMQTRFATHLDKLEAQMANGRNWFTGAAPSELDCYLASLLRWHALYPRDSGDDFQLGRWQRLHALARQVERLPATEVAALY